MQVSLTDDLNHLKLDEERCPNISSQCSFEFKQIIYKLFQQKKNAVNINIQSTCTSIKPALNKSFTYSPTPSPCSSPRFRKKPLRETKRVNSISEENGTFVQLNQYKLHGSIGQGSYGIVKLAYSKEDNTLYAMKILSKKKLRRKAGNFGRLVPSRKNLSFDIRAKVEDPLDKVYTEIAIMKKLDHPNVVKLVEVLDDPEDDNMYMVFELLERGEVLQIPTDYPLSEFDVWYIFRDVLLGLEYLHYHKIIHRDIKPSNLLRADSGNVLIADLGVSNEFYGQDAYLTNTAGTPAFTPPESLSHKPGDLPYSGRSADVWSLGVTLFSLVFGLLPFYDDNILALYHKILNEDLKFPSTKSVSISPELKDLICRMINRDVETRITIEEIKKHNWVTAYGIYGMLSEEENCSLIEPITEIDVKNSVHTVPKLDTLILVKSMIKNHSFSNPYQCKNEKTNTISRSNSAPCSYDTSNDGLYSDPPSLPSLFESNQEDLE